MSTADTTPHASELERSRETRTRGPYEWIHKKIYGVYPRRACYNIRELYIQCVLATDCIKKERDFETCRKVPECAAERAGLSQCRIMSLSPATKMKGNRWDTRTETEAKEMLKHEKAKQRQRELGEEVDETHEVIRLKKQSQEDMNRQAKLSSR
eukprot:TRINITY_DN26205_c0_g1_i1.p1 TRINITY_DN26205_c0_g1~~TRINITY_DN26205_c0_g1_i1.p1  ORF type:complete len:154 (+),score=15.79 TRINITY_DN26205_c0_g1_i1:47-508(+)